MRADRLIVCSSRGRGACRLRQPADQRADRPGRPEGGLPSLSADSEAPEQRPAHAVRALVLRRRHAGRGVLVRRAGGAASHRDRGRRPAPPADRRSRHDHRRVGGELHRARVRALRRAAVRRVRGAVPQARRGGRAARARPEPVQLVEVHRRQRRALGARRRVLRRDPVRRRDVRRPARQAEAGRDRDRHRHLDRIAPRVLPERLRPALLRPEQGSACRARRPRRPRSRSCCRR